METISERIKALRKEKGLTQSQLAEQLNITDKAVSKWEVGEANPDITLLAKMAQIFGVSTDYLLTGIAPEEKIIIKSPKEMLFETDDPKFLESISENDLDIVEMYEHKLANTFGYLVDQGTIRSRVRGKRGRQGDTTNYIKEILFLALISNRLDKLKIFDFDDIGFADDSEWTDEMTNEFISGNRVSKETKDLVMTIHCRELVRHNFCSLKNDERNHHYGNWQLIYPKLLNGYAEVKNWDSVEKLLDIFVSINEQAADNFKANNGYRPISERPVRENDYNHIPAIVVPSKVLDTLLKEKQYDLLDKANKANSLIGKGTISRKTIDVAKVETDDSLSKEEKFMKTCVYNHIINVNLLSQCDDLKLIRNILDNNYWHYYEMVFDYLDKKKNRELYEFFIDNEYEDLARLLIEPFENAKERLLARVFEEFTFPNKQSSEYAKHEALLKNQNRIELENDAVETANINREGRSFRTDFIRKHNNKRLEVLAIMTENNPIIEHIKELKERVYQSVVDRLEKQKQLEKERKEREKMAKGLTKDYFEGLLDSGKPESLKLFKLELCSLLDAIFIYDYHYQGEDFSERMNAHFRQLESTLPEPRLKDDGWGYQVPDTEYTENVVEPARGELAGLRDLFYRLRVSRNNILHPEKVAIKELSIDELRKCLQYVFSINKKVED